jgi:two-component system sensor histidine kinase and response regulator WspE
MSGGSDLGGFSMFELFKADAETHCAALNDGLLAIESAPDDLARIEPLMRAAHSVKGAARIIGLDIVVRLAHAMEDCLVAAQKGQERLTPGRVDQLLQGVDLLTQVASLDEAGLETWTADNGPGIDTLIAAIKGPPPTEDAPPAPAAAPPEPATAEAAASEPAPAPEPAPAEPASEAPKPSAPPAPSRPAAAPEDAVVRVDAGRLNRLMQLAGETMVEARRIQSFRQDLLEIKERQRWLEQALDEAERRTGAAEPLAELREVAVQADERIRRHADGLESTLRRSEELSTALYNEVLGSRMRPFADGTVALPRMVRDLARSLGKKIAFELVGGTVPVDRDVLARLEAPLNHLVRNCVDHGIEAPEARRAAGKPETGTITLEARHHAGMLTVQIRDDGGGIDPESVRRRVIERQLADESLVSELSTDEVLEFLFLPGFSTATQVTEISGRGVGLDVVQTMVHEVSGVVRVATEPGRATTFTMRLPVTLSVVRAAVVEIAGEPYAFALTHLARICRVPVEDVVPVEGRQQFALDGRSVGLVQGAELLELGEAPTVEDAVNVIVVGETEHPYGLIVDRFLGEQDLVVRPLDARLGKVPHLSAAAVLDNGDPVLIVDTADLLQSMQTLLHEGRLRAATTAVAAGQRAVARRRILVVDDSITVREVERQLLTRHGYDVDVAVDGQDGWNALKKATYDLLVTDVDMPRMNGFELIRMVRRDQRLAGLPIIIVSYKDRKEDRMKGMELGANAYLTKGSFHDDSLTRMVADLIGTDDA